MVQHTARISAVVGVAVLAVGLTGCGADVLRRSDETPAPVNAPPATVTVTASPTGTQSTTAPSSPTGPESASAPSSTGQSSASAQSTQPSVPSLPSKLEISTDQTGIPCDNRDADVRGNYITVSFVGKCKSVTISGGYTKVIVTSADTVTSSGSGFLSVRSAKFVDVSRAGAYYEVACGRTPGGKLIPVKKSSTKYQTFHACLTYTG